MKKRKKEFYAAKIKWIFWICNANHFSSSYHKTFCWKVCEAISIPEGLNSWWTLDCKGNTDLGNEYDLIFPEPYQGSNFRIWTKRKKLSLKVQKRMMTGVVKKSDLFWKQILGKLINFLSERLEREFWPLQNQFVLLGLYLRLLKR